MNSTTYKGAVGATVYGTEGQVLLRLFLGIAWISFCYWKPFGFQGIPRAKKKEGVFRMSLGK